MDGGDLYRIGYWITWALIFLGVWIGCAMEYGFLGFALAWMPAAIIATIAAFLWPLLLFGVIALVAKMFH